MIRRLEIGPGPERLRGHWLTLDCEPRDGIVDIVCEWGNQPLPFEDGSFHLVYTSHVLEHIPWYRTLDALEEVHRILRPNGILEVHVPDLDVLITAVQEQRCLDDHSEQGRNRSMHWMHWVAERLFHMEPGPQWHRACFNWDHLVWCLRSVGFQQILRDDRERGQPHGIVNLGVRARK